LPAQSILGEASEGAVEAPSDSEAVKPNENELIVHSPDGQPDALTRAWIGGVQLRGVGRDGHQLHGVHSQRGNGLMANEQQVGSGPRHDHAPHFVGGRANDGAPETSSEGGQKPDEEAGQNETYTTAGRTRAC
jgi:hypothetical protein